MTPGFTRTAQLAVHVVVRIAAHPIGTRLPLVGVAECLGHSEAAVLRIVSKLARAGILLVGRGAPRQVQLARPPETLTIVDIVEAVDGPLGVGLSRTSGARGERRLTKVCNCAATAFRMKLRDTRISDLLGGSEPSETPSSGAHA
jgi:DNA-binding IscR family transcriptional regulator